MPHSCLTFSFRLPLMDKNTIHFHHPWFPFIAWKITISYMVRMLIDKSRVESIISIFVTVHPHETSALIASTSSFFFVSRAFWMKRFERFFMFFEWLVGNGFSIFPDIECVFRGASVTGWRCDIVGFGESSESLRRITAAHVGCCAPFHPRFLAAQSLQRKSMNCFGNYRFPTRSDMGQIMTGVCSWLNGKKRVHFYPIGSIYIVLRIKLWCYGSWVVWVWECYSCSSLCMQSPRVWLILWLKWGMVDIVIAAAPIDLDYDNIEVDDSIGSW